MRANVVENICCPLKERTPDRVSVSGSDRNGSRNLLFAIPRSPRWLHHSPSFYLLHPYLPRSPPIFFLHTVYLPVSPISDPTSSAFTFHPLPALFSAFLTSAFRPTEFSFYLFNSISVCLSSIFPSSAARLSLLSSALSSGRSVLLRLETRSCCRLLWKVAGLF